jgi:cbb3-type cytochrome oxidase maturation protein
MSGSSVVVTLECAARPHRDAGRGGAPASHGGHRPHRARSANQNRLREPAMDVLVFMIPIALFLGTSGLIAFLWALRSGQYDDMDGAEYRMLMDD